MNNIFRQLLRRATQALHILLTRRTEEDDLWRDLAHLLRGYASPICIDVGCHRGAFFSKFLQLFAHGKVFAFEPDEQLCASLKQRYCDDARVKIESLALGSSKGTVVFRTFAHKNLNSLLPISRSLTNPFRDESVVKIDNVTMTTLDTYCREHQIEQIALLKVDTQGADLSVLMGARGLLRRRSINFILTEVNFATLYEGQAMAGELIDFLCSRYYFPFGIYNVRRIPWLRQHGARSRAWFAERNLAYPDVKDAPIFWCDMLFAPADKIGM